MKIVDVQAVPVEVGFARTFSFGSIDRQKPFNVLLRLTTDSGHSGYGEACPVPAFTTETQASVVDLLNGSIRELLLGQDPRRHAQLLRLLTATVPKAPFARAAVDVALWDVNGQALDASVSQLLGGRFRDTVRQHGSVGMGPAEAMAETAGDQVSQGFTTLKLYAGRESPAEDVRRIRAVRSAVGADVDFLLDVNGRWDRETALRVLPELADLGIVLLEQPVPAADLRSMAALTAACAGTSIRIMADESVFGAADVVRIAHMEAAHVINLGLSKLGGLTSARDCAIVASAAGLHVAVGSVLELGVASVAGLHLAASLPELSVPSYLIGPLKYERQVTRPELALQDAEITVPDGAGLGLTADPELWV